MLFAIATLNGMMPSVEKTISEMKDKVEKRAARKEKNLKITISEEAIKSEEDFFVKRILDFTYDGVLILAEVSKMSRENTKRDTERVLRSLSKIKRADNIEDIIYEAEDIYQILEDTRSSNQNTSTSVNQSKFRDPAYYALDKETLNNVIKMINIQRECNVLQIKCREGDTLNNFKSNHPKAITYGLINEMDEYYNGVNRVRTLKTKVNRVALGTTYSGRISNEAFDVMLSPCEVSGVYADNYAIYGIRKIEKIYLETTFKYVREGGVILITLPRFRLTKDMCQLLSKRFSNLNIYRSKEDDYDMCYIVGNYLKQDWMDKDIYDTLRACYDINNVPILTNDSEVKYQIPHTPSEIKDFRGSIMDEDEILEFVKKDNLIDQMIQNQKVEKLTDTTKRPLLPFKVGQIGLVLTSGCLDGLIDEGDGHFHLVKGMVNKQHDSTRESTGRGEYTEEIISSNRVEINVILPNGELKKLT